MEKKYKEKTQDFIEKAIEQTKLNLKTFSSINNIIQRDFLSELQNIKEPKDFINLQMKVAASSGVEIANYMQKSGEIVSHFMSEFSDPSVTNHTQRSARKTETDLG